MNSRVTIAVRKITIEQYDSQLIVFDSESSLYGSFPSVVEFVSLSSLSIFLILCVRALSLIGNEIKVVIIARVNRISVNLIAHVFVVSRSGVFIMNPMPTADR